MHVDHGQNSVTPIDVIMALNDPFSGLDIYRMENPIQGACLIP